MPSGASERSPTPPSGHQQQQRGLGGRQQQQRGLGGRQQQQRGLGGRQQQQRGLGGRQQHQRGLGAQHQEDAAGIGGASTLRPLGQLRGREDWYEEHEAEAVPGEHEDQAANALGGYYNRQPHAQRGNNRGHGGVYRFSNKNRGPGFRNPTRGGKPKYQNNQQGDRGRSVGLGSGQGPGGARHQEHDSDGARHQGRDAGGGPLSPLGPLRGRENWHTSSIIEDMEANSIGVELSRVKLLTYWKDRSIRAEQEISKKAPKFEMNEGIPWTYFMVAFKPSIRIGKKDLLDEHKKRLLYTHLKPKAQRLVGTSNIPKERDDKEFVEYHSLLDNVFEPPAESEQINIKFEARIQIQGEHPQIYYTNKRNLLERAYPVAQRDYEMFFVAVISGLINLIMKEQLRNLVPLKCTAATEIGFAEQLVHKANVLRKRYVAQEISEAEFYGAEAMLQSYSYRSVGEGHETTLGRFGLGSKQIKSEPVYALQKAARATRKGGYADRKCYHYCNQTGHYISPCPRKTNGLPAVVSVEPDDQDGQSVHGGQEKPTVNALGGYSTSQNNPQRTTYCGSGEYSRFKDRNRGGKPKYQQNCRVAYIYENENGDSVIKSESETNSRLPRLQEPRKKMEKKEKLLKRDGMLSTPFQRE